VAKNFDMLNLGTGYAYNETFANCLS